MNPLRVTLLLILWALAIGFGMSMLLDYQYKPGSIGVASGLWPDGTKLVRRPERATLVMFLHPRCGCSRASLAQLANILNECRRRLDAKIIFVRPSGTPPGWEQGELWAGANRMEGVEVVVDTGHEVEIFDAKTSGEAFLYGPEGRLQYHGGITPSRGRVGPNFGQQAVISFLMSGRTSWHHGDVFGCALSSAETDDAREPER